MSIKRSHKSRRRAAAATLAAGSTAPVVVEAAAVGEPPAPAEAPVEEVSPSSCPAALAADDSAQGKSTPSAEAAELDDPNHLDAAFFDSAPDSAHWGVEPAAPSAAFSIDTSQRRERLAKYVRAAIMLSVALCVAALVKAVAARDQDQGTPSRSPPVVASAAQGQAIEHDHAPGAGGAPRPAPNGRDKAALDAEHGDSRGRRPR
ncbi:MAG TPA: hypothetical protein VEK07_25275 [Polyangiaceae bacterium]|nr:hypothetical protein [Polyangiaceae bacterium]